MEYLVPIAFYAFAVIIIASAIVVVFSKNIVYSAFSLLFTFFGVAALYVLLNADFLAITQIMIYIGGILVLIIFGVMLTTKITGVDIKTGVTGKVQVGIAALVTAVIGITLVILYTNVQWFVRIAPMPNSTIRHIGGQLLTNYVLAFEVASVLLLIAIVGAALIARRKSDN
ncbi:MAG: NADH-quinone oxidoreductase subunit [Bacteroidota bacterium]|nr:NADH-quinone oxidoreductase subunit [Bacteroidota bacterium]